MNEFPAHTELTEQEAEAILEYLAGPRSVAASQIRNPKSEIQRRVRVPVSDFGP